jgi:hypothetical protein
MEKNTMRASATSAATTAALVILFAMIAASSPATTSAFEAAAVAGRPRRRPPPGRAPAPPGHGGGGRRRTPPTATGSSLFAVILPPTDESASSLIVDAARNYWSSSSSSSSSSPNALAGTASATLTYLSLLFAYDRPRGRIYLPGFENSLVVKPSQVPNGGLGLHANRYMAGGTILGTYPGVLRPARSFYDGKCVRFPNAVSYSWRFTDDAYVIDPTDDMGEMRDVCLGGGSGAPLSTLLFSTLFRFGGTSTALCRINEPPIGAGGCSVSAREDLDRREVTFSLVRDVVPGQELYLDYGPGYDRSGYGRR